MFFILKLTVMFTSLSQLNFLALTSSSLIKFKRMELKGKLERQKAAASDSNQLEQTQEQKEAATSTTIESRTTANKKEQ